MLKNIGDLGLLPISDNKNILEKVLLVTKKGIVSTTVKYFVLNYEEAVGLMKTEDHVNWYLEVLIQSFQLPKSEYGIQNLTLEIFRKFLFGGDNRPKPLIKNEQHYIREIFGGFSFHFVMDKEEEKEVTKEYILICSKIFDTFLECAKIPKYLSEETFVHLMKILLGIVDLITTKNGLQILSAGAVKTLFEFWICSTSTDEKLWTIFQSVSKTWQENHMFVQQWGAITFALSQRILRILYGETMGLESIRIKWKQITSENYPTLQHYVTDFNLPNDFTFWLWEIFLRLLNPCSIKDPVVFHTACKALKDICITFAEVGDVSKTDYDLVREKNLKVKYGANGDTMLGIAGNWLFEGINRPKEYSDGKSVMYETLLRILIRMGGRSFNTETLSLFYDHLIKELTDKDKDKETPKSSDIIRDEEARTAQIRYAILTNSKEIFTSGIDGAHVLIPSYMGACESILCGPSTSGPVKPLPPSPSSSVNNFQNNNVTPGGPTNNNNVTPGGPSSSDRNSMVTPGGPSSSLSNSISSSSSSNVGGDNPIELRGSCLTIMNSLICVGNHYEDSVYKSLKFQIQRTLVKALNCERNEANLQMILWGICVCVFEEVEVSRKVGALFIHQMIKICQTYATKPNSQYTPIVFGAMFDVFSSLVPLWRDLIKNDKNIVKDMVGLLADQLVPQIKLLVGSPVVYCDFVAKSYSCITDYCLNAFEVLILDEELLSKVLFSVQAGLQIDVKGSKELERVYKCALYLMHVLLVLAGNYPAVDKMDTFHSLVKNDAEFLFDKKTVISSNYARHYLLSNKFLFTLAEQPNLVKNNNVEEEQHGCTLIVRNETGRFTYDCRMMIPERYLNNSSLPPPIVIPPVVKGATSKGLTGHSQQDDSNNLLMKHKIGLKMKNTNQKLDKVIGSMGASEDIQRKKRQTYFSENEKSDMSVHEDPHPDIYASTNKFQMSRLLLSHLGLFHIGEKHFFQLVQSEEFDKYRKELDSINPRECNRVSIMYLKKKEDNIDHIFGNNNNLSKRFQEFLDSIGWKINLGDEPKHRFTGGLTKNDTLDGESPYYADYKSETIYHVFTSIGNTETKKKLLNENRVNIIWCEHSRKFKPVLISTENNQVNIIIYPLPSGLFKIHIETSSMQKVPAFGPLQDGMLISGHCFSRLVSLTALNACMALKTIDLKYVSPIKNRLLRIEKISKKLRKGITLDNLLATIYIQMDKNQIPTAPTSISTSGNIPNNPNSLVSNTNLQNINNNKLEEMNEIKL